MVLVTSQIEIASPPAQVKDTFLNFSKIPEWSKGPIRSIEVTSQKSSIIEEGDTLKVVLEGATFSPAVLENSDLEFKWRGSLYGLFVGNHSLRFEPSKTTPGSTTFVHSEDFSGVLSFMMRPAFGFGAKTQHGFEMFNEDLKGRVEGRN